MSKSSLVNLTTTATSGTAAMATSKPAALPQGTEIGGYRLVRKLSVGGFGVVYLAKDKNNALVAIKEYLPSTLVKRAIGELEPWVADDKLPLYRLGLKSFFEEGRALAQISHPSVVGVQNFFRANETIYMVMNYLQGATLQDFILTARDLKRDKIFRESTIRSLFDEILHGLRIVHQSKMLHLDIKPANLFITNSNKAVLIDFGAARQVIQNDSSSTTRPMYTPGFAAPEMYDRQGVLGPWSDIYAIGACIFASMYGYPPTDALARQNKDKLALVLGRLRSIYSDNLIELVEWCMALDPQSRPQSVLALQKQLANTDNLRYQKAGLADRVKAGIGSIGKLFS
jgi:serine/threonine protein kinase